jgi:hypothetical protein
LKEAPVKSDDGTIHIKHSWSPEYPGGRGQDINFTIALIQWSCQTLLDINAEFALDDPLASEWQNVLDHLVDYQIDENGLRIGKDIAFDKPHRHYSHMLAFYPLALITPESDADAKMLRTTLDHWLDVSFYGKNDASAMAVTGYTATGAASMYACLGDEDKAYQYLDYFIQHDRVTPTTMYAEGNPVIESPLSFATSLHDMLLQSWGGKIRVFRATPEVWGDVAFEDFRTQGAFLVSAKRQGGVTQFVLVESLIGSPCLVQTDIPNPNIFINGAKAKATRHADGVFEVDLKKGETAIFTPFAFDETDLLITPIPVSETDRNLFGLNEKTTRLPGHQHYYKEKPPRRQQTVPAPVVKKSFSSGRIVRVELPGEGRVLSLAEVEVFVGGINVAEKQNASASSEVFGGAALRGVDGNTNGDYQNESVTHTSESTNPWWEVDLGQSVKIEKIIIHNRSTALGARLEGFTLKILDANRRVVFSKENVSQAPTITF